MTEIGLASNDEYASIAEFYDLEHADFDADIDLYRQLAEVVGDPILELGCGSGRVLLPLAAAGYRVTGLDHSRSMLARARMAASREGLAERVSLVAGEMEDAAAAPGGPYGLVLLSLNGLMHLDGPGKQRKVLVAARRALDPRGMLVIDTLHPDPAHLATFDGRVQHEGSWRRDDGTRVDRFAARTHAPASQRIETTLWYDVVTPAGRLERVATEFPMRYVNRAELELMLELAGFAEWQVYGSYDLDPYEDGSERLIVTAEAAASRTR
ncbi:MAG: class I SAM-dependent methyltransferase [Thermomicrobiales bacterium]